jgi:hypothetical protein
MNMTRTTNESTYTTSDRVNTLLSMLTYRRPGGSKTERKFITKYLSPLSMQIDGMGNFYKRIGDAPIMWSCHTDTVHRNGGRQPITVGGDIVTLNPKDKQSNCLGADDTAGIWLMREMILAKRPGLYVFHRDEECGGVGSNHIADKTPELVSGIKFAVALDRRGTNSVITHQGSGRCCSDTFAASLALELGNGYKPDDTGVFTDTANYTDLIGECTNLSVGYFDEHSKNERLDLRHVLTLRETLLALDYTKLAAERTPGEYDPDDCWYGRYDNAPYSHEQDYDGAWFHDKDNDNDDARPRRGETMTQLVAEYPDAIADLLEEYGFDWGALAQEIHFRTGGRMPRRRLT